MITTEELARIRAAAVGDMLGDSKALDEMGPAVIIFRLCQEIKRLEREANLTTSERGSREEAAALLNALPRALIWRSEPQLGAWNWWRDEGSRTPRYVYSDGTVAITMQIDRVPYQDLGGQWAGPIPEPREPK